MIKPSLLKGFRDSKPDQEIVKKEVVRLLEDQFTHYGFVPIDTPALEYTDVLLGKGGGETDKQIFHFIDHGNRDVALRFDLTIPFARFVALNYNDLAFPFKRFHIAKVWRGENPQKGRYREFFQCDFDIVGTTSVLADLEILTMMYSSLRTLGLDKFVIKVAHRGLFNAFLENHNLLGKSVEILRTVDKKAKISTQELIDLLNEITKDEKATNSILNYIDTDSKLSNNQLIDKLALLSGNEKEHSERLKTIFEHLKELEIEKYFQIDPSITRGLDYYTGIVFETYLTQLEQIGSVCSGGRYDNLTSLYSKHQLSGVGSSIGLDRLLAALEELDNPLLASHPSSDVLIVNQGEEFDKLNLAVCAKLRNDNIKCDLYLDDKKIINQYKYAEQNQIRYSLTVQDENSYILRDLKKRTNSETLDYQQLVATLKEK